MASARLIDASASSAGAAELSQAVLRGTAAIHSINRCRLPASGDNGARLVLLHPRRASMLPDVPWAVQLAGFHLGGNASALTAAVFVLACAQKIRMHVGRRRPQTILSQSAATEGAQRMTLEPVSVCVCRSHELVKLLIVICT